MPDPSNLIVLNGADWARAEWDMFDIGIDYADVDHYLISYGKEGEDTTTVSVTGIDQYIPCAY